MSLKYLGVSFVAPCSKNHRTGAFFNSLLKQFESFGIIEIPDGWGSQADVTSIIQTAAAFQESSRTYELYHEISHLWNVDETDVFPPRRNEGLASFLEDLVTEKLDGVKILHRDADSTIARMQRYFRKEPEAATFSMQDFGRQNVTGLSYSVGMLFYYLLYDLIGHRQFVDIQRAFYEQYSAEGATSDFYADFIRKLAGDKAEALVGDWLKSNHYVGLIQASSSFEALEAHYK